MSSCIALGAAIACTGGGDGDVLPSSSSGSSGKSSSGSTSGVSSSGGDTSSSSSSSGGPKGPTDVKDTFSHACNVDEDCVLALIGVSVCGQCTGSNAAIAKSDQATYQTAYNTARSNCGPPTALGSCAAFYNVSRCNASKTCEFVSCGSKPSTDEHHCTPDGG